MMTRDSLSRLAGAALLGLAAASPAAAEPLATAVTRSGLLGAWAVDCSQAPDRDQGAVLTYEIKQDGRVIYRRDFGDARDENEVMAASTDPNGLLNIMVFFPALQETREFGLLMQRDGSLRAIYNRGQRGDYTIRDGKFVRTGVPTPIQHRCGNRT